MSNKNKNLFECSAVVKGIEIELTNHCGVNCLVCPRKKLEKLGFLSFNNFKKIVELLKQGNYSEVMVCGLGDAFLHNEIINFMEYLFKEIPKINLFFMTKGLSIKQYHLDKILELNNKGYNVSLTFSVFSLNEKFYNYLTGGNFYNKFIDVFNKVNKMKINYSLEFMLSVLTLGEFEKFKKFAISLNKDYGISLVHNWGGSIKKDIHNKLFDESILNGFYIKRSRKDLCEVMRYNYLYINSFGEVFQCSLNELDRKGYLGYLGECNLKDFLKKKEKLSYNDICEKCFYFNCKTFS